MMKTLLKLGLLLGIAIAFFPLENHLTLLVLLANFLSILLAIALFQNKLKITELLSPYTSIMTALFVWSFLSRFWVQDVGAWLIAMGVLFIATIFAFCLKILLKESEFRDQFMWFLAGILLVHQLMGWYFVVERGLLWHLEQVLLFNRALGRPDLFFRNINDYALMMFFALFIALNLNTYKHPLVQLGKYLLIFSSLAQIIFAGSRGIFLATLLAIGVYVFRHIKDRQVRQGVFISGMLLVIMFGIIFARNIYTYLASDASAVIRFNLIRNGHEHLKMTNFIGVGAGNVSFYLNNFAYYWTGEHVKIHNWFMGLITANGLIFGVIYLVYYVWNAVKAYQINAKFVLATLAGFLIAGFVPDSLFTYIWFWVMHHMMFMGWEEVTS